MTLRLSRRAAMLFVALVLASVALVVADQRAAHAAACAGGTGVTVIVDFTAFSGGAASTRCAPGDPTSGLTALTGAGFTITGTTRWGLAFVCRINGLPTAASQPCVNTPPATAYWSYWHGTPGGSWTFSSTAASSYNPAPGTVEGWAFGAGTAPSVSP